MDDSDLHHDRNRIGSPVIPPASGFPAVGITEEYRHNDTTPYIHRAGDTYETIDFEYLASCTRIVGEVIKVLITTK